VDKIRMAALEATLRLYRDPDRLAERLPTVRLLARPKAEIAALAARVAPLLEAKLGDAYQVEPVACASQIGSGALPMESVPSAGIAIKLAVSRGQGRALAALATALRKLPAPVIGRVANDALVLDLRCLEDEAGFAANLRSLDFAEAPDAGS
jgi:L-seryl-tRNA(Ser) seleniumtransferase